MVVYLAVTGHCELKILSPKTKTRTGKMAHLVKVLVAKPDDLTLIPKSYSVMGTDSLKLSFDFCMLSVVQGHKIDK